MIMARELPPRQPTMGGYERREVVDDYLEHIFRFIDPSIIKPFACVLDAGSGMGGLIGPKIFARLPCRTSHVAMEVDGTFPHHESNPLIEENRRTVTQRVLDEKADIGIAWDGDADRCFFIDGTGDFVAGDFVTALLAEAFLMKYPGEKIIYQGRQYVAYRGMGSLGAMQANAGSRERYGQGAVASEELVPQGIEGMVPYAGTVKQVLTQYSGGLRASMGFCGCRTVEELHRHARFMRITPAGMAEGHPHNVNITKEAPNYRS